MKKIVLACFAIVTLTNSCVRDKKQTEPLTDYGTYNPSVNLGEYCWFKKNSYWVYQDSVSGKIDCTYVTGAQVTSVVVDANDGKNYVGTFNYYNMYTKDGIGDIRQYEVRDEEAAQRATCCNSRYDCEVHWNRPAGLIDSVGGVVPGIYFGAYTFMFNDFNNGASGGSGYGEQCWSRGIIGSLSIYGNQYNNSVLFENYINIADQNWNVHPYRFKNYVVKNIGVVKRIDLDSNRTWLLKRYNVMQ